MHSTNNTSCDGFTGLPLIVENTSEAESSSTPSQLEPRTFILSPDESSSKRNQVQVYSVKVKDGNPEKRKFVPINVVDKIVEKYSLGAFAGANYSIKSTTPHHLVVHNQQQLDFVNWQIENGYIGKDMLKTLELLFEPKDVQRLPISLTSLTLHGHRNLSATELKKIFDHLPKLEAIECGFRCNSFNDTHFNILASQGNLKKICLNNKLNNTAESQGAFVSCIVNKRNLHTLQFESKDILPPGGAQALADSNIHTLKLGLMDEYLDDCKILLGSQTIKSLDLQLGQINIKYLEEAIRNCGINNLNLKDSVGAFDSEFFDYFANSNRAVEEKKINLSGFIASGRDLIKWVLEPQLFQDVSMEFERDLDISEEFFERLMAHPGRVRVILHHAHDSKVYEQEWSAKLAQCHTLHTLSARFTRSDLENFVGHPSLTTLRLHSFEADCLGLLADIPFLTSLYLGKGLTGETAEILENNHTLTKIGIKYEELTEDIAKSFAAMRKLNTVDLRSANLSPDERGELALKRLLVAKQITKIHLKEEHQYFFTEPELAQLLRDSSAGRVQFWQTSRHYRVAGPELRPVAAPDPQVLA